MKKFNILAALALAGAVAFCGLGISCSSDGLPPELSGNSTSTGKTTTQKVATSGTVSGVTTAADGTKTATLTASNGAYKFTESSSANAYIIAAPLFDTVADTTKGGTWTFTETGATSPKYKGTYKGDISKLSTEEVKLDLTVKAVVNSDGKLVKVEKEEDFALDATTTAFEAEIPAVTASSDAEEYKEATGDDANEDESDDEDEVPAKEFSEIETIEEFVAWLNENYDGIDSKFSAKKWVTEETKYTLTEEGKDGEESVTITVTLKTDGTFTASMTNEEVGTGDYALSADEKYFAVIYEEKDGFSMEVYEIKDENTVEELGIKADDGHSGDDKGLLYTGSDEKTYIVTFTSETAGSIFVFSSENENEPTELGTFTVTNDTTLSVSIGEKTYSGTIGNNDVITISGYPESNQTLTLTPTGGEDLDDGESSSDPE